MLFDDVANAFGRCERLRKVAQSAVTLKERDSSASKTDEHPHVKRSWLSYTPISANNDILSWHKVFNEQWDCSA